MVFRVRGVQSIDNNLTVSREWIYKTDLTLHGDVKRELYWNPYVEEENVIVTVDDGVVTLDGVSDSWFKRRQAAEEAKEAGAKVIENNLRVQG